MGFLSKLKKKAKKAGKKIKSKGKSGLLGFKSAVDKGVEKTFGKKASENLQAKGKSAASDFKQGKVISGTLKTLSVGSTITGAGAVGGTAKVATSVSKASTAIVGAVAKPFKKQLIVAGIVVVVGLGVAMKLR